MSKFNLPVVVALAAALAACSHVSPRYGVSGDNVEKLRMSLAEGGAKVSVGSFSTFEPGLSSIGCRAEGPVIPPDGVTYEKYIEQAIASELKIAGAYSDGSSRRLEGRLDYITFNSNIGMGKWRIDMTFQGPDVAPFSIGVIYPFSTNWVARVACTQVATALPAAVQDLIAKLVVHPSFRELVANSPQRQAAATQAK